ncbi:NYN domain-containing protein [Tateyamaria sp.]|uniref:NYN domain-containing protein n=1 Tax=Tateyamaria sp. TaxID=1929288 RepID=UPI00329F5C4B
MIDGSFFLQRIKNWPGIEAKNSTSVKRAIVLMCQNHIRNLTGTGTDANWLDHVYRMFFYDAHPYEGAPFNPIGQRQINFSKSNEASFRRELFDLLRKERKFALRLGILKAERTWTPHDKKLKAMLKLCHHVEDIEKLIDGKATASDVDMDALKVALSHWHNLSEDDVYFPLRQKGVDMKIGLDIASMTLKRQVDTIVLVTGDSDFVPAAKVARREGVEFILDPMWQSVDGDLMEHIDGIASGFDKPYRVKE